MAGTTPDITVRGAGVFGLSVAWACARRGASVRVIDLYGPGSGSSGGVVGALAPHVPEAWNAKKAFQLEALLMAGDWWAGVAEAGGTDPGYARTGRLQPLAEEAEVARARERVAEAEAHWQGRATWEVVEATGDWAPVAPSGWCVRDTLTARLHPRRAIAALQAALGSKGVTLSVDGEARGQVIHATGWRGMIEMSDALGRTIGNGVKGQAALLRYDAAGEPQIFAEGVHIVPHADGTVAIGSTSEREWEDETATDAQLDYVIASARRAMPALEGAEVIERWAGIRPRARSRAPMLGAHPLHPGQFIANGGFKIGFGLAPLVGEVMADLILEGTDRIPEDFKPQASGA